MMPTGAGPMLFITSTTESLKLASGSSVRATRRRVVRGFALSPNVAHGIPNSSRNAQSVRATSRKRARRRNQQGAMICHVGTFFRKSMSPLRIGSVSPPSTPIIIASGRRINVAQRLRAINPLRCALRFSVQRVRCLGMKGFERRTECAVLRARRRARTSLGAIRSCLPQ
jgi:hypothetical protein